MSRALLFLAVIVAVTSAVSIKSNDEARDRRMSFKTYWNMPTFQCARYNLGFDKLAEKYHIIQNQGDQFRGDQISLLYDPGLFPAIRSVNRNGGLPQEGNLTLHLDTFSVALDTLIPDKKFSGVAVIDMEDWRPLFRQNFGTLLPYKDLSIKIEKQKHPLWSTAQIQKEAERRFEKGARDFMEKTLLLAKKVRPNASWGYYAYPYCFNYKQTHCAPEVLAENDRLKWLFTASDNLYPSIYFYGDDNNKNMQTITGRITEAKRIRDSITDGKKRGILPYFTLLYDSTTFLTEKDITSSINLLKNLQIDGLIIWGSSNHVNTKEKCEALYRYIDTVFGPALIT